MTTNVIAATLADELSWARRRPLWLVAALTFLSQGVYFFFWIWFSWRELKRLRGDVWEMFPFWHAVTFGLPIYGFFRFHAHFRVLQEQVARAGVPLRFTPLQLTLGWVVLSLVGLALGLYALATLVPALPEFIRALGAPPGPALQRRLAEQLGGVGVAGVILGLFAYAYQALVVYAGQRGLNSYYEAGGGGKVPERTHALEWTFLMIWCLGFVVSVVGNLVSLTGPP